MLLESADSNLIMEETDEQKDEARSHPSLNLNQYEQNPICLTLKEHEQTKFFENEFISRESRKESRKSILEQEDGDFKMALEPITIVLDYFKNFIDLEENKGGK